MLNWLRNRLSPVKRATPRWRELAEALEEYWSGQFDPLYESLAALRSIYTADVTGQLRKIAEYGSYYEQDMSTEARPIYFAMRKLEMLQKETDVPMMSSIQRLGITGCSWQPLYAMSNEVYGTRFLNPIRSSWEADQQLLYLTSRGMLQVDFTLLNDATLLPKLEERVRKIKPLHIVYDGIFFTLGQENSVPVIAATIISAEVVTIYPWVPPEITQESAIVLAAGIQSVETVFIYPK